MKRFYIFLLVFTIFSGIDASAQIPPCPTNIDFELGNLSSWTFFNGLVASGPVYTLTVTTPVPGREDLTSGAGTDAYGGFPVVGDGSYSCKLGHDTVMYCAERARYQVHVPTGLANYSLVYRYAMVLEDGGHAPGDQPRFEVEAYDSVTGAAVPCASANYVASASLPGFTLSSLGFDVYYRGWATATINLSGYGGKTVTIDFTAADCALGGHFGYGYFDMSCGLFAISTVACNSSTVTLIAPGGYNTYSWYDSLTFTHLYGVGDTISIPTPPGPTTYAVILVPYFGFGCQDTLYTRVRPNHLVTKPSNDTSICLGPSLVLTTNATDIALPLTYSWSGPGILTCSTCDPVVVTPALGINSYTFTVTDAAGCSVTDSIRVVADKITPAVAKTDVTCYGRNDGTATATATTWLPPLSYSWSTTPIQTTSIATGIHPGSYLVTVTDKIGCKGTAPVTIIQPPPNIIVVDSFTNPATCLIPSDGTITIGGLVPYGTFTISYRFNGIPLSIVLLASGTGKVVLTGLGAGIYDNITVVGTPCPYNVTGPVVLKIPSPPLPPTVVPQTYCQFLTPSPLVGTGAGLLWYGPGLPGVAFAPTPKTDSPGITYYYVTQTVAGCVSDTTFDSVIVYPKPGLPVTSDTTYCQFAKTRPLYAFGDSLKWYTVPTGGARIDSTPIPLTDTPGKTTWYVNQTTIHGCIGDRTPQMVTVLYKPIFSITAQSPWVCQYDSLWLAYNGPDFPGSAFVWNIPTGEVYVASGTSQVSLPTDSMIYVRFDVATDSNYFSLYATHYNGLCAYDTSIRIKIVPPPTAQAFSKVDVCVGDTVSLALSAKSPDAAVFTWTVDNVPLQNSQAVNILAHNQDSGGPFSLSWNDSGSHIINVYPATEEGCINLPEADTIHVHTLPDASFHFITKSGPLCLEDSVLFVANTDNYNNSYRWTPEHFFNNINKSVTSGMVQQSKSFITLQVTDPFGCVATNTAELDPGSCCTVNFPNAFSPDKDGINDFFRPIIAGFHRFHVFRIANRWGQTVYESTNNDMKWDGTFNGVPQDVGVYFYYIKYDCGGGTFEKTGDITLIR